MASLDSLYKVEDGHVLIEIKLSSVIQLFNSFDPAPFHEKELDEKAEEYIVDTVMDLPSRTRFKIVVYLPDTAVAVKEAQDIPAAVRAHFLYKALGENRRLRERYIYGQFALVVGLVFVAIATAASMAIENLSGSYPVAHLIATILQITGWVAMWEPVTVFLFQLWPIRNQRKLYEKISRMETEVRPYQKIATPMPVPTTVPSHTGP